MNDPLAHDALRSGSPALFRRTIALYLKRWRLEAGKNQGEAAKRIGRTIQHISNIESDRTPTAADLELLLVLYGQADRVEFMLELLTAAKKASNWWTAMSGSVPKWFDLYLGLEDGATTISSFDSAVVPGLLQTRAYAEAVHRGNPDLTDEQVTQAVEIRLARPQILDRKTDPVHLSIVLDESVLLRPRGDATVMRDQFAHLIKMSKRPRIDLQVLPLDTEETVALVGGSFSLLNFAQIEGDPGLVYLEPLTGGRYVEKPDEIDVYRRGLTRLHSMAASPRASRGIIERAMKEVT